MCEPFNHEAYNSKFDSYKRQRLHRKAFSAAPNPSELKHSRMGYSKVTLLSSILLVVAVVRAQDYLFENYNVEPNARARRDAEDFVWQRDDSEVRENVRLRRDDEGARHRRQGGHGGGSGGGGHEGITGPVHTFVKTDEHAHFKWGVRHHVGHEYAGHR